MIGAIIQARIGSTRLPNKVLRVLCGKPLIWHIINRIRRSTRIEKIILATTTNINDDLLVDWALENDIEFYRGSENDVLSRFYHAAKLYHIDCIVRITADDPFKDYKIIDQVIDLFEKQRIHFAYNNNPPSFPEGLDTEVFSFDALEKAFKNAVDPFDREHVTQYFYKNNSLFSQACLVNPINLSYLRWTIDTQQDWDMAEAIYNKLYPVKPDFSMTDILELINSNPYISEINSKVQRSAMYNNQQ
jgi:spore coat polysaccharide biosynthesis protein SpsF